MTNGEKIKEVFPNLKCKVQDHTVLTNIDSGVWFSFKWWNTEYQEPSSSEKPNKSIEEKCPCYYCEHFEIKGLSHCKIHEDAYGDSRCNDYHKINQKPNKSESPTGSNTKNDLGVELIDRAELLKAMDTWDKFGYTARYGLERLDKDDKDFVPYVKYDDMVNCVKNMPPATPIRPKGHWKLVQRGKSIDVCCSNCEAVRVKEFAYNYTIDRLDKEDVKKCLESDDMRYCPYCGSDNKEVEE